MRSGQWTYALPTNDSGQQVEADKGSLFAIRSAQLVGDLLQSQRLRKVPDCGTLENPLGSKDQQEGPAWCLPEIEKFMKDFDGETAEVNTCGFQQKERVRWWKPGKIGGKLPGMKALAKKCNCPKYFKHEPLIGKEKTARAAEYPAEERDSVVHANSGSVVHAKTDSVVHADRAQHEDEAQNEAEDGDEAEEEEEEEEWQEKREDEGGRGGRG